MPPKVPGKMATKGQKQIVAENKETLQFYFYIITATNVVFLLPTFFLFWESFTAFYIFLYIICCLTFLGSFKFMSSMARATYDGAGNLLDGGIDLNMEKGMAENMKDLILLTAIVQTLTLFSNYFWLFLLLAPGRALYMLWVNILAPWFFQEAPEVDEKKQKKMERKMKRAEYGRR